METTNILSLFSTTTQFVIPSYQRAYSWGKDQREQFIQDLRDANNRYYLGHFLFEKDKEIDSLNLIDGQQRLTTVVIFFSCLCEEFKKRAVNGESELVITGNRLHHVYIRDSFTNKRHFKTVHYDDTFFLNEIIDRNSFIPEKEFTSSSQRRIRHCREFFEEIFAKETTKTLLHWAELIEYASTTEFKVASKIEAAQIFAFQNDRGKRLSNLEVLKSFFMLQIYLHEGGAIQDDYITRLNKAFQDIYEAIVNIDTNEDDILRYFWIAYSTKGYNTERPLEEIKSFFNKKELPELIKFVDLLARAYRHVVAIEKDSTFDMRNLKRLDNMALTIPIFIKARVIASVTDKTYNRLVKFAENITFRQAARGGRAVIENRLHNLLVNSKDDDSFNLHLNNYINGMQWDYWNDNELKRALSSGYIYGNRKVCRYLLWRYEQSLCPPNHPATRVVWEDVISKESLEHIAPQTRVDEELAHGYGIYRDIEHPENGIESGEWLNSIGNMLLLSQSQNSAAGNKDLIVKLEIYKKENSLIRQQQEIYSFMENPDNPFWDKGCIERRGKHIIETALSIWDVNKI